MAERKKINTDIWFDSRMEARLLKILNLLTWGGSSLHCEAVRDGDQSMVVVNVLGPANVNSEKPDEWDEYQNLLHFIAGAVQFMGASQDNGLPSVVPPLLPLLDKVSTTLCSKLSNEVHSSELYAMGDELKKAITVT